MMPALVATQAELSGGSIGAPRACWATGSAFYIVLQTLFPHVTVVKSMDGSTWDVQDSAHQLAPANEVTYSSWLHSDGFLYVLYNTGDIYTYAIRRFDTATDTWETSDYTGSLVSVNVSDQASVRIVVCADGDVVCCYQDVNTTYPTVRRWNGTSWGAETPILTVDGRPIDAIVDGSDRVVLAWEDVTNHAQSYSTLDQTDTFGRLQDFDSEVSTTFTSSSHMCRFNDGANDLVAILTRDTGGEVDCHSGIEGATLGSLTTVERLSAGTVNPGNIALTFFAGQLYACWSDYDVFHTISYAVSTSLAPLAFAPEVTYTPGGGFVSAPLWLNGLGALGFCYHLNNDASGQLEIYVEWLVQPDGYHEWPAWDTSQQTIFTRE